MFAAAATGSGSVLGVAVGLAEITMTVRLMLPITALCPTHPSM
jgi:hypothetical protein